MRNQSRSTPASLGHRSLPMLSAGGFTLIEVMISAALVLIIMLGINTIFSTTTQTVGAGNELSTLVRDLRGVQTVVQDDLRLAVTDDAPLLIIASERQFAFMRRTDELADDGDVTTINIDGNNNEGDSLGETVEPAIVNSRSHRIDRLGFFARGQFPRQTGNAGVYAADMTSSEAYIWYGHLWQPDNKPVTDTTRYNILTLPGAGDATSNPNNRFATQWLLGRMAMLLREEVDTDGNGTIDPIADNNSLPQVYIERVAASPPNLTPLHFDSQASTGEKIYHSRYDLAETSIETFKDDVATVQGAANWYLPLLELAPTLPFRFRTDRYFPRPLTAEGAAKNAPILLDGCTQFIVEYAGDYLTQDPVTGAVISTYLTGATDGVTDFVIVTHPDGSNPRRRVRWYGFPRNSDLANDVDASNNPLLPQIRGATGPVADINDLVDTVPLRDVLTAAGVTGGTNPVWEKNMTANLPPANNYASAGAMADDAKYYAVWSPADLQANRAPTMLRIVMRLDGADGRIADGQTAEFIVELR